MKKFTLLFVLLLFCAAGFAQSGTTGNLKWSLSGGTLTISGNGAMPDYIILMWPPWDNVKENITAAIIENGVTSIGEMAFAWCSSLTSVTIPNSVKTIGERAFFGCDALKDVTVEWTKPLSIKSKEVFSDIDLRKCTLYVPSGTAARYRAAGVWKNFGKIVEQETGREAAGSGQSETAGNLKWSLSGGTLTISGNGAMPDYSEDSSPWYNVKGDITAVIIKNGVTSIGNIAFDGCFNLTSVTIPNSVTTIGIGAFASCRSLTSVTIPNSVTTIGNFAFYDCRSLNSVTIPNSVTTILGGAFSGCVRLKSFSVSAGNPNYTVDNGVLFNKAKTKLIQYPPGETETDYTIPSLVTTIGENAFWSCDNLTSVTIPNSVTTIGEKAFAVCDNLTSVTIPNSVTTIGEKAFAVCSSLKDVTVEWTKPLSIESDDVFSDIDLTEITLHVPSGRAARYRAAGVWKNFGKIVEQETGREAAGSGQSGTAGNLKWSLSGGTLTISGNGAMPDYSVNKNSPWDNVNGNIAAVIIKNGVTSIGSMAFFGYHSLKSITISNSVTTIGNFAFGGCDKLTSVTIPNSVTTIGGGAFASCYELTSVTIPNSVTTIGNFAFGACYELTSVTIPNSVTTIEEAAFDGCSSLKDVTVKWTTPFSIRSNVFSRVNFTECTLHVPSGTAARYRAAGVWKNFGKIVEQETGREAAGSGQSGTAGNLKWSLSSGTLTISGNGAMPDYSEDSSPWYNVKGDITAVIIENGVTSIGKEAFGECINLTSVTIPNSVTTIGIGAFYDCSSLNSVTIPNSVTTIWNFAFYDCRSLNSVTIPNSVTTILGGAFSGCVRLKSFSVSAGNPNYTVDNGVLFNKAKTKLIQYPPGETETDYTIPSLVTTIGENAFWSCDNLTSVTIPNSVTTIGDFAFYNCSSLNSVTIPNSVTTIGYEAFVGCSSLTSVTIPNSVTTIGIGAFGNCSSLKSVTIPSSVTTIEVGTFSGCNSLTSVTIPNSVMTIEEHAFDGCRSLTSVTIPNSVTTIGDGAFFNCSSLKSVTVDTDNPNYTVENGVLFNKAKTELVLYPPGKTETDYTIPSSVTTIGGRAFAFCYSLTSVTIPNSVTTIGDGAFFNCSSLTSVTIPNSVTTIGVAAFRYCVSLKSVTIPNSVTTIGKLAFYDCDNLTSVTIPNSVTTIGEHAFDDCYRLKDVTVEWTTPLSIESDDVFSDIDLTEITLHVPSGTAARYRAADVWKDFGQIVEQETGREAAGSGQSETAGNLKWSLSGGTLTISGNGAMPDYSEDSSPWYNVKGDITAVIIENGVTSIGNVAFGECINLTSVTIPNSVTTIEVAAFRICISLKSVTIPNSVTTIGEDAFLDCHGLTSVTIPNSVTTIGGRAFAFCYSLTSVTIPNSVTTIGDGAFFNCSSLTSVTIPNSVTTIGDGAFFNCSSLTSVTIPNSVTTIGVAAFRYCVSLKSVTIPNSVTTIGKLAFYDCDNLTSVTIPNSVTTIGEHAFDDCYNLKDVTVEWTTPLSIKSNVFSERNFKKCTLHVPSDTKARYKNAGVWKNFRKIVKQ